MDLLSNGIELLFHLDKHLGDVIAFCGVWTYVIVFIVIFCETGLVVTPFLPGDSLLFALGTLAANPYIGETLQVTWLTLIISIAAVLGNTTNYAIGRYVGPRAFNDSKNRFLKKEYLIRTQNFYEKYGGKTIFIARFVPIIRTYAPFMAGVGMMHYGKFSLYNVTSSLCWTGVLIPGGYLFGDLPIVRDNFTVVIIGIIVLSLMPGLYEYLRYRKT
ncbi:MAG: DedA family protein [Syntrophales bacterium]|nr:DedA family protein [Syntrophales bacterium]